MKLSFKNGLKSWISLSTTWLERALKPWLPDPVREKLDWSAQISQAQFEQTTLRARFFVRFLFGITLVFILWTAFTPVDEISRSVGKVIPSRQLQVVQSVDGGVVLDILVREGQVVNAGDVLMKIDPTRFVSSLRENRAQYLALSAKVTRLQALSLNQDYNPSEELQRESPDIVEQERKLYQSTQAEIQAQLGIAQQQLDQRSQELKEVTARRDQAERGLELSSRELAVTRPLIYSGAVSEVELIRLEREVARYRGERDQANAQIARVQAAIREAKRKIQEVQFNFQNQIRNELSEANAKFNALAESGKGLQDRVKYTDLKAPLRGTVKRLFINTEGGVVQPGKEVAEIVPLDDELLLEARVSPREIAFLSPGQKAVVKLSAYDFTLHGALEGRVEQIGADTLSDDQGNPYYLIRVRTTKNYLGKNLLIIPGMVAEVDVITGSKSLLSYFLKPVLRAREYAFTER
ncbi:MAG: HlyD family type I secretion periplasmic adaptor subunit [Burkholderiales bacterium]|jgi:adhesin transport system membrane fusion protein|nr:HlyD family type I secretion periplasmic adaptor subunit [Burkholderiales bacterium]MCA3160863.1 HlyD family type I secretion periplasmic adaptor subunit [Burkholderiales bacterium]MCA3163652.1 HlyD family type I secretion periplasmic adaptor subunit [Burkholderiales bacterium]MCA3166579.1 HlyD family type I secretion periplasmic adaptor subunit [Burkholderiales bacterium]MCA3170044.1 HlyD family type I secretion periplasmic adaptor subunit [Burkholderiales bacterium]